MNAVPPKLPTLRPAEEVQHAHDVLYAQVMGQTPPVVDRADMKLLQCALEVLCWVLGHSHINSFPENLAAIEAELKRLGFVLRRHHELFVGIHPPTEERPREDHAPRS